MKENLLQIINHYRVIPQLKYFQSEVFELNEAIIKYENIFKRIRMAKKYLTDNSSVYHNPVRLVLFSLILQFLFRWQRQSRFQEQELLPYLSRQYSYP